MVRTGGWITFVLASSLLVSGCANGPRTPRAVDAASTSPREAAAAPTPPASAMALIHGEVDGLSFDYPADWTLTPVGHWKHYETVLAFLTSPQASAIESCGPDYEPGLGAGCEDTYSLPAGSAVVRLSRWGEPQLRNGPITSPLPAGWQPLTIAAQPAAYTGDYSDFSTPSSGQTVAWLIAAPGSEPWVFYAVVATINGPQTSTMTQIEAMLATLRISPTVAP